jgi:hypothetical protein
MRPKLRYVKGGRFYEVRDNERTYSHQLVELARFMTETDSGMDEESKLHQT